MELFNFLLTLDCIVTVVREYESRIIDVVVVVVVYAGRRPNEMFCCVAAAILHFYISYIRVPKILLVRGYTKRVHKSYNP